MQSPTEPQLRWILRSSAALLELGAEPVAGLVLPTAEHFPDAFDGSPKALAALLRRVMAHAGLADVPLELAIEMPEEEGAGGSCGSGGCGSGGGKLEARAPRVASRKAGGYVVTVPAAELGHPVVLTTGLARAAASIFMREAEGFGAFERREREAVTDLAAVLLGFGVLVQNGSYVYMKGCGSVKVHSATRLEPGELGVALAIFCRLWDAPARAAARHLDTTPRAAFEEGLAWVDSNAPALRLLAERGDPDALDGVALRPAGGWLARTLGLKIGRRAPEPPGDEALRQLEADLSSRPRKARPKSKNLDEIKALVDEALER